MEHIFQKHYMKNWCYITMLCVQSPWYFIL